MTDIEWAVENGDVLEPLQMWVADYMKFKAKTFFKK